MSTRWLVVPSETRHREFDAKLFLACVAAERGLATIVGSRTAIHLGAAGLPRAIWLAKDLCESSARMTRILRGLGHRVVALDEEALVWYSPERYRAARLSPEVLRLTDELFAWGEANADNWRAAPAWRGQPIHVTGNPRFDLLRPELRGFFDPERDAVRARFGRPLLVNTNFGSMNHFVSKHGIHEPDSRTAGRRIGEDQHERDFHARLAAHRRRLFEAFLEAVPALARAFPDRIVVVRPHPAERAETWRQAVRDAPNVEVLSEGHVAPWLLAAGVVIHNGCTTGIEAHLLGTPAVAYRPWQDDALDLALPNRLSSAAADVPELIACCERALAGTLAPTAAEREEQAALMGRHLAAASGPFAAERIVDRLAALAAGPLPDASWPGRLRARVESLRRRRAKLRKADDGEHKHSAAYTVHRFASLTPADVETRLARLRRLTGRFAAVRARLHAPDVFVIAPQ
ncbi:MAG: hypothetical protein IT294_08355 [Deltaproteobacteria bacterium]|nr:hypothetical protein [Deltaproteobacteria bacterium]